MSDRSEYTNDGMRGQDAREGFGDDMGTRVGRPDGAKEAPREAGSAGSRPGQPGTNGDAVAGGIEGSIMDDDAGQAGGAQGSGPEQSRVRQSTEQSDMEEVDRPKGDNRPTYNL